ncbi:hypothetical protein DPMN_019900 [Dreissena polymorpha]|uniref:Uncharacterized protein n=1 Tax=Dreissena polymorpha TaxID=45954 RepID=A0A9D4NK27_DREPO|nr:hypothetical protein DPMN_019900 [Dreissena polymorpha]
MMFTISVYLTVDTESPLVFSAFTAPELLLKSNPPGDANTAKLVVVGSCPT